MEDKNKITEQIIGCCFKVHTELGPGFNEKVYQKSLMILLEESGLKYETEKIYNIPFHDRKVGALRLDLIVNDEVIVETGKQRL